MLKYKDTVPGVLVKGALDMYIDGTKLLPGSIEKLGEAERTRIITTLQSGKVV